MRRIRIIETSVGPGGWLSGATPSVPSEVSLDQAERMVSSEQAVWIEEPERAAMPRPKTERATRPRKARARKPRGKASK